MKQVQNHTPSQAALLRSASRVDAPVKKSLCCVAAGITAPPSSTAEALIPHERLRSAALADATLNARKCPLAQLVIGYNYVHTSLVKNRINMARSSV